MAEFTVVAQLRVIPFGGSQITWAGESPFNHRLAFCDELGVIHYTDFEGNNPTRDEAPGLDVINGLAFCPEPRSLAISTRSEIVVSELPGEGEPSPTAIIHHGAHGIIASRRTGFIASAGVDGGEIIRRVSAGAYRRRTFKAADRELYFYRIVSVGVTEAGEEVLACAGRSDGLLSLTIDPAGMPGQLGRSAGHPVGLNGEAEYDIIDVCPVSTAKHPFAVVALGINNSLHFTRDVRTENPSAALRLREAEGTAYSLLCVQGHLVLLTSESLYILPGLAARLASGEPIPERTPILRKPIEAVDCFVAYGRYLLLVVPEGAAILDIERLLPAARGSNPDPRLIDAWGFALSPHEQVTDPVPSSWVFSRDRSHVFDAVGAA